MSFISYAQNFEDVLLWRALKQVQGGFYIDVGANDPVVDSVTKAFYDRGWHGINLEPVPRYYHDLQRQRPNDINLQLAAGAGAGSFTLYEVESVRGWGTLDSTMAAEYRSQGYQVTELPVTVTPLAEICQKHVTGPIHFLKIDVEGAEEQVLRGMDFNRWRPWIVIAESRVPTGQGPVAAAWESLLLEQGYQAVYFDGVNTFYLADEHHPELGAAFSSPPNALDDFVRQTEWRAGRYAEELEQTIALKNDHINRIEARLGQLGELEQHCANLEEQRASLEEYNASLMQHCANLEQQHANLEQRHVNLEQRHANLEQHCANLEEQRASLEEYNASLIQHCANLEQRYASLEQHCANLEQQHVSLEQQHANLEQQLAGVYASSSWRVTAPLRTTTAWLRGRRTAAMGHEGGQP